MRRVGECVGQETRRVGERVGQEDAQGWGKPSPYILLRWGGGVAGDEGGGCLPGCHFGAGCFVFVAVVVFSDEFGKLVVQSLKNGELCCAEQGEPGFGGS